MMLDIAIATMIDTIMDAAQPPRSDHADAASASERMRVASPAGGISIGEHPTR